MSILKKTAILKISVCTFAVSVLILSAPQSIVAAESPAVVKSAKEQILIKKPGATTNVQPSTKNSNWSKIKDLFL